MLRLTGILHHEKMREHSGSGSICLRVSKDKSIRAKDFMFCREGKEVQHEGKMYDILTWRESADAYIITCVEDNFETELNALLSSFIDFVCGSGEDDSSGDAGQVSPFVAEYPGVNFFRDSCCLTLHHLPARLPECNRKGNYPPPDFG